MSVVLCARSVCERQGVGLLRCRTATIAAFAGPNRNRKPLASGGFRSLEKPDAASRAVDNAAGAFALLRDPRVRRRGLRRAFLHALAVAERIDTGRRGWTAEMAQRIQVDHEFR